MKNEKYSIDDIRSALRNFHKILVYIQGNYESWGEGIKECDKAICDIEHYVELNYGSMTTPEQTKIVRALFDRRIERRQYKDRESLAEPIIDWINKNKINTDKLNATLNQCDKFADFINTRTYTPRVETKLFEELSGKKDDDNVIAEVK